MRSTREGEGLAHGIASDARQQCCSGASVSHHFMDKLNMRKARREEGDSQVSYSAFWPSFPVVLLIHAYDLSIC